MMLRHFLPVFTLLLAVAATSTSNGTTSALDDRPIIAIFAAPSTKAAAGCGGSCDYLAASYIKWIESAGGRVVPVPFHATNAHIDSIFSSVNGLLFPGGGAGISDSAKYFYQKAIAANKAGDYFPVWGTCLGFEWLLEATASSTSVLDSGFDSENISMALELTPDAASSRMFGKSQSLLQMLSNKTNPPTMNNHQKGIETAHFKSTAALNSFYNVLSTNQDRKGREFVSTIEAKTLPVYGTQWHPEKNAYEWGMDADGTPYEAINHSADAVAVAQALVNFFVGEARKSKHRFDSAADEAKALIYNYAVSSADAPYFIQVYFLKWSSDIAAQVPLTPRQRAGLQVYERE